MITQICIAVLGTLAIFITQQKHDKWKRYACLFGMASQPFFLYATYTTGQFGMLALSIFYTWAWGLGIYNNWLKPEVHEEQNHE